MLRVTSGRDVIAKVPHLGKPQIFGRTLVDGTRTQATNPPLAPDDVRFGAQHRPQFLPDGVTPELDDHWLEGTLLRAAVEQLATYPT